MITKILFNSILKIQNKIKQTIFYLENKIMFKILLCLSLVLSDFAIVPNPHFIGQTLKSFLIIIVIIIIITTIYVGCNAAIPLQGRA